MAVDKFRGAAHITHRVAAAELGCLGKGAMALAVLQKQAAEGVAAALAVILAPVELTAVVGVVVLAVLAVGSRAVAARFVSSGRATLVLSLQPALATRNF